METAVHDRGPRPLGVTPVGFVEDRQKTRAWVTRFLSKLLTRPIETVILDIQRSVAQRGLSKKQRKLVDKCLKYFERHSSMMNYPSPAVISSKIAWVLLAPDGAWLRPKRCSN